MILKIKQPELTEDEPCEVNDWFAIGSFFAPANIRCGDETILGMRQFLCIDVASHYIMDHVDIVREPDTVTSADILPFLLKVMSEIGMPKKGFIILESIFLSSNELADNSRTKTQGEFLQHINCAFDAMTTSEQTYVIEQLKTTDLKCSFQGLEQVENDVTLAFSEIFKQFPPLD